MSTIANNLFPTRSAQSPILSNNTSASSGLLQAPPPTRTNSPPPALNLNNVDISAGPPLSFDGLDVRIFDESERVSDINKRDGNNIKADRFKDLPSTPPATVCSPILCSSTSIPLVVISPPESNHGSPIVSPYVSPSPTSVPVDSSDSALPFSPSSTTDDFGLVAGDVELSLNSNLHPDSPVVSDSQHLSESWHPRSELTAEKAEDRDAFTSHSKIRSGGSKAKGIIFVSKQDAIPKTDVGGGGTSPSCYSLESAPRSGHSNGSNQAIGPSLNTNHHSLSEAKNTGMSDSGSQHANSRRLNLKGQSLIERLTRILHSTTRRS